MSCIGLKRVESSKICIALHRCYEQRKNSIRMFIQKRKYEDFKPFYTLRIYIGAEITLKYMGAELPSTYLKKAHAKPLQNICLR